MTAMEKITYRPARDELAYTFGGRMPVAHLRSGDVLEVFTEDCFGGLVRGPADLPSQVCRMPYLNPVSGPFFVEDAEPGDTLAIHLISITPARDWGVSSTFPHFGALTSTSHTASLQPPLEERVWVYGVDRQAGTVRFQATETDHTVDLPLEAMIGTIGVAPGGFEARSTIVPDRHGGNLDTPQLRTGTTLYLGVKVHGAMLALGDGHARQGEGEACGVGVEIATTTTLTIEVIKGAPTMWPRLETDTSIMSIGCARPLEDAYRIAQHDMVGWVQALTGLETLDAYQFVSQAGRAPIGNVCDPNYTVLAAVDKALLPSPEPAYGGVHSRLRQLVPGLG
ncbi:acetamidase/formamidase family protein [Micromonospora sp. DR5-3]|uniref:acetamidase/formamidase family protein n=1 Tax=unclassified Micromonospora TaxID=2617518 RepID=UPI0011D93AFA|nr:MULTISPECIES: acetamidase/formamidase family protein [unclassified Micromonospora]MCW3819517.1 acetamidase/formamidase family protein [Micromonospora sp. DR5-3]TYC21870.1 acetamidase [Micromonospora sp. MP36]